MKQALHSGLLFACSSVLKMVVTWSSKVSANFNRLHDILFPKIELYITTAVRTLNPAFYRVMQALESRKYC
jgi:hypothetical protein